MGSTPRRTRGRSSTADGRGRSGRHQRYVYCVYWVRAAHCRTLTAPDMPSALDFPSADTVREAQEALRQLRPLHAPRDEGAHVRVRAEGDAPEQAVTVPRQAFELFLDVLGQLANGNAVTIAPVQAELTTQQAADLLNVSRPYLVALLERGELPFRRVGSHRRVAAADLFAYQDRDDARRGEAMAELTAEAQRLGLGY